MLHMGVNWTDSGTFPNAGSAVKSTTPSNLAHPERIPAAHIRTERATDIKDRTFAALIT